MIHMHLILLPDIFGVNILKNLYIEIIKTVTTNELIINIDECTYREVSFF